VVYRMIAASAFKETTVEAFAMGEIEGVLLMSPRTAAIYARLVAKHGLTSSVGALPHFCLSVAVARQLQPLGAVPTKIAEAPRLEEVLALIDETAAQSGG
jgi:uroporphyrinogen-III synthase